MIDWEKPIQIVCDKREVTEKHKVSINGIGFYILHAGDQIVAYSISGRPQFVDGVLSPEIENVPVARVHYDIDEDGEISGPYPESHEHDMYKMKFRVFVEDDEIWAEKL